MHRFFAPPEQFKAGRVSLDRETLDHLRVLRLGPQERFILCDGAGMDYHCILAGDVAEIVAQSKNEAEPRLHCTVYLAYTKGERMDYAVQKSVELGAGAIHLFPAARCVAKYDEKTLPKKITRWGKIALEAAKQSGRGKVPPVTAMPDYNTAIEHAARAELPLFLYEGETHHSLRHVLEKSPPFQTASLVIGPEGGFAEEEAALALELGLASVSLGPRILRAETAALAALAAYMAIAGDWRVIDS